MAAANHGVHCGRCAWPLRGFACRWLRANRSDERPRIAGLSAVSKVVQGLSGALLQVEGLACRYGETSNEPTLLPQLCLCRETTRKDGSVQFVQLSIDIASAEPSQLASMLRSSFVGLLRLRSGRGRNPRQGRRRRPSWPNWAGTLGKLAVLAERPRCVIGRVDAGRPSPRPSPRGRRAALVGEWTSPAS